MGFKHQLNEDIMKMSFKNIALVSVGVILLGAVYFYLRKWMSPASAESAE